MVYMKSREYHAKLYTGLGTLKNDFRNYNLVNLIALKIKGRSILDIGCGNGYLLSILTKKGFITFGIEPNPALIRLALKTNPRLHIAKGYAENLGKIKDKFDNITMIDVLEHISKDEKQIKMVYERLRPKGQFILVVPAFKFLYGKRDRRGGHYRRYSKAELEEKLKYSGFKINSIRYWNMLGFFPYLIYEKLLKKELNTELRTEKKKNALGKIAGKLLDCWFKYVENNLDFGFGLSIICVAKRKGD